MNDQQFTRILKEALENIQVSMPTDAWYEFHSKHFKLLEENPIDNVVYEGVNRLPLFLNLQPDWNAFMTKLDIAEIDEFFQESLTEEKIMAEGSDWDSFSEMLSEQEADEVDDYIKEKLNKVNPNAPEGAWERLAQFMEARYIASLFLWSSRGLEIISMSLILWTITLFADQQILNKHHISIEKDALATSLVLPSERSNELDDLVINSLDPEAAEETHTSIIQSEEQAPALGRKNFTHRAQETSITRPQGDTFIDQARSISASTHHNRNNRTEDTDMRSVSLLSEAFNKIQNHIKTPITRGTIYASDLKENAQLLTESRRIWHRDIKESNQLAMDEDILFAIESLSATTLSTIEYSKNPVLISPPIKRDDNYDSYIAFYFNQRIDAIYTPYNKKYNLGPFTSIHGGYGLGMDYSYDASRRLKLGTGIAYNQYTYTPPPITETYGRLQTGIKRVTLEEVKISTLALPLNMRYSAFGFKNVELFVSAGLNINLVVDSDYKLKINNLGQGFITVTPDLNNLEKSESSQSSFYSTLMDGEPIQASKIYSSIYLGTGGRYMINRDMFLLLHLQFENYVGKAGLTPNNSLIDGLNIKIGMEFKL